MHDHGGDIVTIRPVRGTFGPRLPPPSGVKRFLVATVGVTPSIYIKSADWRRAVQKTYLRLRCAHRSQASAVDWLGISIVHCVLTYRLPTPACGQTTAPARFPLLWIFCHLQSRVVSFLLRLKERSITCQPWYASVRNAWKAFCSCILSHT